MFKSLNLGLAAISNKAQAHMAEGDWDQASEAFQAAFQIMGAILSHAQVGDKVAHPDFAGMHVVERTMDPMNGPTIVLTQDGKRASFVWARGLDPEVESDEVYAERWVFNPRAGQMDRVFHGWIDSVSREVVQTG